MSWEVLRGAAADRRLGSAAVAAQAAPALAEIARTLSRDAITDAARVLVQGQPTMAACLRLAHVVLLGLDADGPVGAARAATAFAESLAAERRTLAERLRERLPREGTVVTVSASSTVIETLCAARHLRVLCAVSDPGGEGRGAVEALRSCGVEAELIPDGAVAQQCTRADVVLFGADALGSESLLNKTGTLAAALGARSAGRPCWCLAGRTKLVTEDAWPSIVRASEYKQLDGVPVFEEVPIALVTKIVMEDGPHAPRTMRRLSRSAALDQRVLDWLGE
jgi:translation initiation factor 2B subunit (eIF-2B alpha/beta/delta family)